MRLAPSRANGPAVQILSPWHNYRPEVDTG